MLQVIQRLGLTAEQVFPDCVRQFQASAAQRYQPQIEQLRKELVMAEVNLFTLGDSIYCPDTCFCLKLLASLYISRF